MGRADIVDGANRRDVTGERDDVPADAAWAPKGRHVREDRHARVGIRR